MKTSIKLLALLMCLVMLVSVFAACGDDDEGDGDGGTTTTGGEIDAGPIYDLEGYIYRALIRKTTLKTDGNNSFPVTDFWVEKTSDNVIEKAVYDRNVSIEENYNCHINAIFSSNGEQSMYQLMESNFLGGEKYELAVLTDRSAATCATSNLIRDLNSLKNLQLDNKAYDQNANSQLAMGGKLYYTSGSMNTSTMDSAYVTIFNTEIYNDLQLDTTPFQLVNSNQWTIAKEIEIAEIANTQISSGTVLDPNAGDIVGYFRYANSSLYHFYAGGGRISTTDGNGYPEITINNARAKTVVQGLYDNISSMSKAWIPSNYGDARNSAFNNGGVLFTDLILWDVRGQIHGKSADDYGMLPMPKADTAQEEYYCNVSLADGTASFWTIPTLCGDIEKASYMFNLMALESDKDDGLMDAFYSKTIELTTATGSDSREMCKLIRNSLCYDIAQLYDWGSFIKYLNGIGGATANTFSSTVNSKSVDAASVEMNKTLISFKNPTTPTK